MRRAPQRLRLHVGSFQTFSLRHCGMTTMNGKREFFNRMHGRCLRRSESAGRPALACAVQEKNNGPGLLFEKSREQNL